MSGTAPDPTLPHDAVEVARIAGAWGVKGALRIHPHAGSPQALLATRRWFLQPPLSPRPAAATVPASLDIVSVREQAGAWVATAAGIADREAAQALHGARIFVSRASFPQAAAGEYYWVDLIGCRVVNREDVALGVVAGLIDLGPHAVLQVRSEAVGGAVAAAERLIPFVDAYLDDVDLAARCIRVDWSPED